jgi:hypothetical protein
MKSELQICELGIIFFQIAFGEGIFEDFRLNRMIDVSLHNLQFELGGESFVE